MAQDINLGIKLRFDGKDVTVGLADAAKEVVRLGGAADRLAPGLSRATSATDLLTSSVTRLGGAAAAAFSAGALSRITSEFTDFEGRLKRVIGSTDEAAQTLDRLEKMARRTYSSVSSTTESFLGMSISLKELGYSTNRQLDFAEALNNALVVSGAKQERAVQVQDALTKAMALGALSGINLNTVISAGGRVAELLAERLGVGVNQLRALGERGEITGNIIYEALAGNLAKVREEADAMAATTQDGVVLVGDAVKKVIVDFDRMAGASKTLSSGLVAVADNMQVIATVAGVGLAAVLGRVAAAAYANAAAQIAQAIATERAAIATRNASAWMTGAATASTGMATASRLASAAITGLGGPLGITVTLLTLGATAWTIWGDSAKRAADKASAAARAVAEEAARLGLTELEVAQRMAEDARERWEADGGGMSSPWREKWLEFDKIYRDVETRERNLAAGAKTLATSLSDTWSTFYASSAEQRQAELDKLDKMYATEAEKLKGNAALQLRLQAEYVTKRAEIEAKFKKRGSKDANGLDTLVKQAVEYGRALDYAAAHAREMTTAEKQLATALEKSGSQLTTAAETLFRANIEKEKAAQIEAEYIRLEADAGARRAATLERVEKETAAIEGETKQLQEQAFVLINGKDALERMRIARIDDTIAAERHTLSLIDGSSAEAQAIRDKITALEAEKAARAGLADAEVIARQREAWTQFSGDIERSLTDALMRGFENGNTAGENFVKALQNTLKTAALKIVVQAIVDPVMGGVSALGSTSGLVGTVGGASGSGLAGSAASNLLGTAISGYAGNGLLSLGAGSLLGGTLAGSFTTGAGAALVNGVGIAGNLSAAGSLIGTGTASGIATGLGMAAPYVGAALAIASAVGLFGKGGGPQVGQYGKIDAAGYSSSFTMSGGDKLGNEAMAQTAYAQAQVLFALAGKSAAELVLEQGYKMDPQGTAGSRAYRTIKLDGAVIAGGTFDGNNGAQWTGGGSDAQGAANYLGKLTTSEILALTKALGDPQLSATVARLAANFSDLNQGLSQYLVAQNAQKQLSWALMSEEELHAAQLADAQRVLTQTFGELGRAVPQSAAEFRAYVESIDITTQAGQDQITTLTGVRDAFLFVQQAAEGAGAAVDALAGAMSDMQRLASEITHIDTARGNLAAARYNVAAAMDGFDAPLYWQETQDELAARLASALSTGAQLSLAGELQDAISQGYQAQLNAIVRLRDERLAALKLEESAAQAVTAAVASLAQFAQDLSRSRFAALSPEALLDATAQRYAGLVDAAGAGDVAALNQLQGAVQEYLTAAQAFYASGSGYVEVFAGVQQSLAELSAGPGAASSAAVADWQQQAQAADAQYRQAVLDLQQQTLAQYGELDAQLAGWQRELVVSLDEQMLALTVGNASLTTIAGEIAALSDGIGGVIGESFTRVMTAKQQGDQAIAAAQTARLDRLIEMQQVTVDTLADRLDAMTRRLAAIESTNRLAAAE